jgi:hypothetical protein
MLVLNPQTDLNEEHVKLIWLSSIYNSKNQGCDLSIQPQNPPSRLPGLPHPSQKIIQLRENQSTSLLNEQTREGGLSSPSEPNQPNFTLKDSNSGESPGELQKEQEYFAEN